MEPPFAPRPVARPGGGLSRDAGPLNPDADPFAHHPTECQRAAEFSNRHPAECKRAHGNRRLPAAPADRRALFDFKY